MRKPSGIVSGWVVLLLVAFLAIPLLGWISLPVSTDSGAFDRQQITETADQLSISSQASPARNVIRGRDLFMGNLHFKNGGPPCMGCHNIGSNGLLGGGAMGPDLTDVTTRLSPSELADTLTHPGPVMAPIFAEHPLTTEEQADLTAFMKASAGQPETNREWLVISISLIGFLAAVGVIQVLYRRRLRGVRKPLLRQSYSKNS